MLVLLVAWMLITLSALAVGAGVLVLAGAEKARLQAPVVAWIGLAAVSTVCSVWSLWLPLGHSWGMALYVLSLFPLASQKVRGLIFEGFDWPSAGWASVAAMGLLFMSALLKATGPTEVFDDAIGYIVIFRAMLDEGVIIGLGNLHPNLAYNSHWSLLGAFYSFEWLTGRALYDINGWLGWLGAWYAFSFLPRLWKGQVRTVYLLLAATPFFYFRNQMSGNNTDLPLAILTWTMLAEWLLRTDKNNAMLGRILFIGLPLFALSIKVTALSIVVLIAGFWWMQSGVERRKTLWFAVLAGLCILGPWVARNVLMTGYAYYIIPGIDVFDVDWKMPLQVINRLQVQVQHDIHHTPKHVTELAWWRAWWYQGLNGASRIIVMASALSIVAGLVALSLKWGKLGTALREPRALVVCGVLGLGLLIWFATPTEPRYAHGILTMASLGLLCFGATLLPRQWHGILGKGFTVLVTLATLVSTYRSWKEFTAPPRAVLVWPAPYPQIAWLEVRGQNFTAHFPYRYITRLDDRLRMPAHHLAARDKYPNCWCTPLPCVYRREDLPLLQQRGPRMRDGYRFTQAPKE